MRAWCLILVVLSVAACSHAPKRREYADAEPRTSASNNDPCAPTRVHRDSDYTPGGLYAPEVADSAPTGPIDVSALIEPLPREEARSRYGNRSPYTVLGKSYRVLESAEGYVERGIASWYGSKFNGRATSSGEPYDICSFSAAHKTLPLPSYARVTNLDNGRSVVVRINDRGPFHDGRLLDLSYAAAVRLGIDRTGTARVEVRAITADAGSIVAVRTEPAPAPNVTDSGRRIVQVGSFSEKSNARRLANRLEDAGVDAVDLDHARVEGRAVWRVKIGPIQVKRLSALLAKIRALDLPSPQVFAE